MAGIVLNMHKALNQFFAVNSLLLISSLLTAQLAHSQNQQESASGSPAESTQTTLDQQALLEKELGGKGLVSLEANGKTFSGRWHPDSSGNTLGAVLIFHGEGQHINWPNSISDLAEVLSLHGWASLSISLPDPLAKAPPKRPTPTPEENTQASEQEKDENSTKPSEPNVEKEVKARSKAGMAFLNNKGQYNIVFAGNGLGAIRAARFLDGLSNNFNNQGLARNMGKVKTQAIIRRPVRALIMIDARNHITSSDEKNTLMDWLNDPELPILDIYSQQHYLDAIDIQERKKRAKKKQLSKYFQVHLKSPDISDNSGENMLTKRVRGFLQKYAKGVEIESK
ncbi:Protein of unknown function [Alteromonadaceae bacterium Bs31]|nr:Protein of unknown function [Alteromonadaceae bacterium Bs31]